MKQSPSEDSGRLEDTGILLVARYAPDVKYAWWLMERFWAEIARLGARSGRKCILAYPEKGEVPEGILAAGIEPVFMDVCSRNPSDVRRTLDLIRSKRIASVYLTDRPYLDPLYAAYRSAGVTTIVNHDHTPGDRPPVVGLRGLAKATVNRLPWVTCDLWISLSPLMKWRAEVNGRIPGSECRIVQNGIDPVSRDKEIRDRARDMMSLKPGQVGVVTTGRAHAYKGVDFVIRAAAEVRRRVGDRVVFFHIGDGPALDDLKELARNLGLDAGAFRFEGQRSDVRTLLPGFDVAMHASKGEGFSLAVLEYMSAGLATLLPDIPSVCQAVEHGETGLIYRHDQVDEAAQRLRELTEDADQRRRLGEAAASSVEQEFPWTRTRSEFQAVVEEYLV